MNILRSERAGAIILLTAAALGLLVANTVFGPSVLGLKEFHLAIPGTPLDLSVGHWVADGLLAVFSSSSPSNLNTSWSPASSTL